MAAPAFQYASSELDALASARNYYASLMWYFGPHLGARVMEVGAGVGTFAAYLRAESRVQQLTLVEPAVNNVPVLRARFRGDPGVRVVAGYLEDAATPGAQDTIVAVNVLEHVADDHAFLRTARETLAPGGTLLLFVPALQSIYGTLDTAFEHHRRYGRSQLRDGLTRAGFRISELRFSNSVGVLSWFLAGRVMRRTTLRASDVQLYDRLIVPWLSRIERRVRPPLGQSLIAIAHA